ncbi:MAG: AraC family transcriptional regulator [Pseudomonadaceae bacterium]|nr:MAG: AraC family transcriptional regulator [Pseudomonadaceae bacterium]
MSVSVKSLVLRQSANIEAVAPCDNLYLFNHRASILTTASHPERFFAPYSGALALSLSGRPFLLETSAGRVEASIVAIAPLVRRRLCAPPGGIVLLYIQPGCRWFGYFAALRQAGFAVLSESPFGRLKSELQRLYQGHGQEAEAMAVYAAGLNWLGSSGFQRSRVDEEICHDLMALVDAAPDISLQALAERMHCPYTGMSRLFRQTVGLSLREYKQWLKHRAVFALMQSGMSLTQIAQCAGFTDSAHLSRIYRRTYGVPPSHSRKRKNVKFFLLESP